MSRKAISRRHLKVDARIYSEFRGVYRYPDVVDKKVALRRNATLRDDYFDCSSWWAIPVLARQIRFHVDECTAKHRPRTKGSVLYNLTAFFKWLDVYLTKKLKSKFALTNVDQKTINAYYDYLLTQLKNDRLSEETVKKRLSSLRILFDYLQPLPGVLGEEQKTLNIPSYSPNKTPNKGKKILDDVEIEQILECCILQMREYITRFDEARALIKKNKKRIPKNPTKSTDYQELGVCLAAIDQLFPDQPFNLTDIRKKNQHLASAVQYIHRYLPVATRFFPVPINLIPFVVILTWRTLFNSDPLLSLERSSIKQKYTRNGKKYRDIVIEGNDTKTAVSRTFLTVFKHRSGREITRSFRDDVKSPTNPNEILRNLERITARLRNVAPEQYRDRVFLYFPTQSKARAKSYGTPSTSPVGDSSWQYQLKRFIQIHGLPSFILSNIRDKAIDGLIDFVAGDLHVARILTGHAGIDTLYNIYTSSKIVRVGEERLAFFEEYRNRWVATHGGAPFRRALLTKVTPAATPGFVCLDPYDSPMAGQIRGQMCSAYGDCPVCPMAAVDSASVEACQELNGLECTLVAAISTCDPERFKCYIEPRVKAIHDRWLVLFPRKIKFEADKRGPRIPTITIE